MSRQSFVVRGALAAGAVYGLGAVGPFVRGGDRAGRGGDVAILNFALTLEYLEAAFYDQGLQKAGLSGDAKMLASEIRDNEVEHVAALTKTIKSLGGKPVKAPGVDFGNAFASQKSFLKLARRSRTPASAPTTARRRRSSRPRCSPRLGASCRSRRATRPRSGRSTATRSPMAASTSRST